MKASAARRLVTALALAVQAAFMLAGWNHYASVYRTPLFVEVSALVEKSGDGISWSGQKMEAKNPLASGDRFQINFTPRTPCYAYLVHVDRKGKSTILYARSTLSGMLETGITYTLPKPKDWYTISEILDEESIMLVFSGRPLGDELLDTDWRAPSYQDGEWTAFPLSDGSLFQTRWQQARGKGVMAIRWSLLPPD